MGLAKNLTGLRSSAVAQGDYDLLRKSNWQRIGGTPRKLRKRLQRESIMKARGIGNLVSETHLSAREQLHDIQFARGDIVRKNLSWVREQHPPFKFPKGGLSQLTAADDLQALRKLKKPQRKITPVLGNLLGRHAGIQLSARDRLNSIVEFKELDLGHTYESYGTCDPSSDKKKHYPSLYISDRENDIELPLNGTAKVRFKLRSKTTRQDDSGKKRHSADIEIQSIDPLEEEADKKPKEGEKAKLLSARDQLDVIQFGAPIGITESLAAIARRNKAAGASRVIKRKFMPRAKPYFPSLLRKETKTLGNKWAEMSARDQLGSIIQFGRGDILRRTLPSFPPPIGGAFVKKGFVQKEATDALKKIRKKDAGSPFLTRGLSARDTLNSIIEFDPRPRNMLGMFSGEDGSGPDPNAIDTVYKRQTGRTVGQNLAGGAVAGVGAAASGTAVKALLSKLKKTKV